MTTITIEEMQRALSRGRLNLRERGLTALPDDLSPLAEKLRVLDVSKNALTALPESLGTLRRLTRLIVSENQLAALPDVFGDMPELKVLDVRRNKLKALPPSLSSCAALQTLRMASNKLKAVPDVFWHIGGLVEFDGVKGYPNGARKAEFIKFYGAVHRAERPPAVRGRAFALFNGAPDAATPIVELFEALTIPHDAVRTAALAEIARRSADGPRPKAGDKVVIVGKTHGKRTDFKERLAALDIGYGVKIDARTTHVVVGPNPKKWAGVERAGLVFLDETGLVAALDALDTPYLIEEAAESPEAAADVAEMLASPDADTVAMGLELVSAGGMPDAVQTALFYVAKGRGDKKLGAKARKILKVQGSPGVKAAIAERSKLFSTSDRVEFKTSDALRAYRRRAPELDWGQIALWIKRDHGVGLRFAVQQGDATTRRRALEMMIDGGTLNMLRHFAGHMPSFYNVYAHHSQTMVPAEVLTFTELTGLDLRGCCFDALPPAIGEMQNLRLLDLRGNMLTDLPAALGRLKGLETLHLGNNLFEDFPSAVVEQLTGLKTLTFVGNRGEHAQTAPTAVTIPDEVKAALPGCAFEDGLDPHQKSALEWYWKDN